jgi:ribosomal protein S18 acetylase RimI-like enzyme
LLTLVIGDVMPEKHKIITAIEELSLNSWPALQTLLFDGWVIRFAQGFTKRSNSVSPLYGSSRDPEEKIQWCEHLYQDKGLEVVFKMTPAVAPENLDEILKSKGYIIDSPTSVQILELGDHDVSPGRKAVLSGELSEEWQVDFCQLGHLAEQHRPAFKEILNNIVSEKGLASFRDERQGNMVGGGLGVVQEKYVGLYDIVIEKSSRNRGFGKEMVLNLLSWGKSRGAETAYLHVMLDNAPALRLYAGLGFRELYRYWYRVKNQT